MKRTLLMLLVGLSLSSPAFAVPFTWSFSGVADSGDWDGTSLAGLGYTLRLFADTTDPDQNGFNGFGQWFSLPAEIEIASLGTRTLGNFVFNEQFSVPADADRMNLRGPGGAPDSNMYLPVGTLGDPDILTPFGPLLTLGDGRSDIDIIDTLAPNFQIQHKETAESRITVAMTITQQVPVPEPGTLALLGIGLAATTAGRSVRKVRLHAAPRCMT